MSGWIFMNYEERLLYIEETPKFTTKNKLEPLIKECLRRLGNPQKQFQVVHVAGTNGKGSTCAFLTSVFREAGYSCGLFTSPHLVVINERFQINEKNIDNDTFLRAFEKVKKTCRWAAVAEVVIIQHIFEFLFLMGNGGFCGCKCGLCDTLKQALVEDWMRQQQ